LFQTASGSNSITGFKAPRTYTTSFRLQLTLKLLLIEPIFMLRCERPGHGELYTSLYILPLPFISLGAIIWLRQMFTISQTEIHLCAVPRSLERGVHLGCWLPDLTNAHFARLDEANCKVGTVRGFGNFEFTSASFRRDIDHDERSIIPVLVNGAGGWAMF
jgi:hypothetical protein